MARKKTLASKKALKRSREEDLHSSCESESSDTDVVQEAAAQTEKVGAS